MNALLAIMRFEARLIVRNFLVIFFSSIFPVGLMILFGYVFGNKPSDQWGGYGFVDVSLPAYLGIGLAVSGLLSFPMTIAHYRERKVLKRFKATPAHPLTILIAQFLLNALLAVLSTIFMFLAAKLLYAYTFRGSIIEFIGCYFLVLASIFSIGMVIASIVKKERTAEILANMLFFVFIFLSGSTVPFEIMPIPMQKALEAVPLTHGIKLFKMVSMGLDMTRAYIHIIVLAGVTVVGAIISLITFRWE